MKCIKFLFTQAIIFWLLFHHKNSEPFANQFYAMMGLFINLNPR